MDKQYFVFMSTPFRSGSGLISRIFNAHSKIAISQDKIKFFNFCYDRYLPLDEEHAKTMLNDLSIRLHGRFNIKLDIDECLYKIKRKNIDQATIYGTLLEHFFNGKEIIGEMETLAWTKIPSFLDMFPNSKALLIVRDLRDVLVSFKKNTIAPGNDYLIALFDVIGAMDHFLEYQDKYPDRFYGIRYETLKADAENEVRKICAFLEVDYEPEMLNEENWTEFYGNSWRKWKNRRVSSFYDEGKHLNPVGRWRSLISPEDWYLCEWIGREQMKKFGLEVEGKKFTQDHFNKAMQKLTSSELLRESFKQWCDTGRGVERYPLDPLDPKNWQRNEIANPEVFNV